MTTDNEMTYLRRCIELAAEALEAGDAPFGSVSVDGNGKVLQEDRNRANTVDATYHPEIAVAKWAAQNMIVYISSSKQLSKWMDEMGVSSTSPIHSLSIQEVAPNVPVEGPIAGLDE